MRKNFTKKMLAVVSAATMMLGMSTVAYAAEDDIVLNDAGSPFIREIDPGEGDGYSYMGYVYCGESGSADYKYLQLTYSGDATALSALRIELLAKDGSDTGLGIFWFAPNDEGTLVTVDNENLPAPTAEPQTVIIDLAKSGVDISNGIHAFHIHDTKGTGKLVISDARFIKALPSTNQGESGDTDNEADNQENQGTQGEQGVQDTQGTQDTQGNQESTPPKMGDADTNVLWVLPILGMAILCAVAVKGYRKNRA